MKARDSSECLRRLLRGRALYTCAIYRFTLVPRLLYMEIGYVDVLCLEGALEGYRWGRWPKPTIRWRPRYN